MLPDFAPVDAFIHRLIEFIPLNGAALLIARDDEVIYERAYAAYTLDMPKTPVASGSKWVTGAVIASLIDDGALYLDERVSDYLLSFDGDKSAITLRQLLAHTSGLPKGETRCVNDAGATLEVCANEIAHLSLAAEPGAAFAYGENSFQVAGRVAEVATGKSWDDLFRERIAAPLKMHQTDYGGMRNFEPGDVRVSNPRLGDGLRTTLHDYGNFVRMLANDGVFEGRRILKPETVATMGEDHTFGAPVVYSPNLFPGKGYGLGAWRDIVDEQGRAIQLSSSGASGFTPWIDTQRKLACVFLVRNSYQRMAGPVNELKGLVRGVIDTNV
jgi:CubicO group peptidase (beta-lactamase class C family)